MMIYTAVAFLAFKCLIRVFGFIHNINFRFLCHFDLEFLVSLQGMEQISEF